MGVENNHDFEEGTLEVGMEPGYHVASDSENGKPPMTLPNIAIGIDIGTSQCSVAVWNGSEPELVNTTRARDPAGPTTSVGSAIFTTKRLVGRVDTDPVVVGSTRSGLPFKVQALGIGARPIVTVLANGAWRSTTPEEVLAVSLVEARAAAESRLSRGVSDAVLTVPATFGRFQLSRVERACAAAGLRALRLMPEPTAVALLYSQRQRVRVEHEGDESVVLVFNIGAGHADVAVSATASGVSQIRAVAGAAIGGEDLLQNTMRYLIPEAGTTLEICAMGRLRVVAQDAIHKLSEQTEVLIEVELGSDLKIYKVLERREFEELNRDVFEKCSSLIAQCLRDAKCRAEDLNDVILVGGCSEIPRVKQLVKEICKRDELYDGIDPLEGAVLGAAVEAAVASCVSDPFGHLDLLTIQVTPHAIGIRADGGKLVPVVPRNSTVPTKREAVFGTANDGQTEALVAVHEWDESQNQNQSQGRLIGYFKVVGIPPAPRGTHEISVCMDIDASNVLRVFAGVVRQGSVFMEVRMPTVDDGYGWCAEALTRTFGTSLDLVSLKKKI